MAVATLLGLTYSYPASAPALDGVDLELGAGTTLVHGPSGGGKSTLLRTLNGLVPHFHGGRWQGRATVVGIDVLASSPQRLSAAVGFVFQDPERQSVAATVDAEVAFGLENHGVQASELRRRVGEALDSVGASHLAERRLAQLSGGERQLVQLAAAIALRPALLVLDEPTSQLDDGGARAVQASVAGLAGRGTAVVLAEHRLAGLRADRAIRVEGGRVFDTLPAEATPAVRSPVPIGPTAWEIDAVAGFGSRAVVEARASGRAGEVVALAGVNGSGKTTVLRTLAGLQAPLSGAVRRAPGRVAYLPQDPAALLHRATVADEVRWTLELARRPHARADVAAELELQGVADVAGRYPRDLSGGQRERAALAAVLAGDPVLVLLDEPTRGMDERARSLLVQALDRVATAGAAVVMATHDRLLTGAADRVLRIDDGVLEAGG